MTKFMLMPYMSILFYVLPNPTIFSALVSPSPSPYDTSGVRAVVVDAVGELQFDSSLRWAVPDDPDEWLRAAETLMRDVPVELRM